MKQWIKSLSFLILVFIIPFQILAWNAVGHMVIADIAYKNLKPTVRDKVDKLLVKFNEEYADIKTLQQTAYWPDAPLYAQNIRLYARWHYIDVAFSDDGTPLKNLVDSDNIVWAMKELSVIVKNANANAHERARSLAFLTHFVGDIHQPLHTVSRISAAYPDGDKGGNSFPIQYEANGAVLNNLHKLWDSGVGNFDDDLTSEHVAEISNRITTLYPATYFNSAANDLTFDHWTEEGVELSKTVVYKTSLGKKPSADYIQNGKKIADQRAALAGYRLAAWLNQLLA
jgi:hypothetical protein